MAKSRAYIKYNGKTYRGDYHAIALQTLVEKFGEETITKAYDDGLLVFGEILGNGKDHDYSYEDTDDYSHMVKTTVRKPQ